MAAGAIRAGWNCGIFPLFRGPICRERLDKDQEGVPVTHCFQKLLKSACQFVVLSLRRAWMTHAAEFNTARFAAGGSATGTNCRAAYR